MDPINSTPFSKMLNTLYLNIDNQQVPLSKVANSYCGKYSYGKKIPLLAQKQIPINEKNINQFLVEHENLLDQILYVFNDIQLKSVFDLSPREAKDLMKEKKLANKLTKIFINTSLPKHVESGPVTKFRKQMEIVYVISKAIKVLDQYHPADLLHAFKETGEKNEEDIKTHFSQFIKNQTHLTGNNKELFDLYSLFIKKNVNNCYSEDPIISGQQMKILRGYIKDHSLSKKLPSSIPNVIEIREADHYFNQLKNMQAEMEKGKKVDDLWEIGKKVALEQGLYYYDSNVIYDVLLCGLKKSLPEEPISESKLACLEWLLNFSQAKKTSQQILEEMDNKNLLPLLCILWMKQNHQAIPAIWVLEKSNLISNEWQKKIGGLVSEDVFNTYLELYHLLPADGPVPYVGSNQLKVIEDMIGFLKRSHFPQSHLFEKRLEIVKNQLIDLKGWSENIDKGSLEWREFSEKEIKNLFVLAAIEKKWEQVSLIKEKEIHPKVAKQQETITRISFMLDKLPAFEFEALGKGSYLALSAKTMIHMFKSLKIDSKFLKPLAFNLTEKLIPLLQECILISEISPHLVVQKIQEQIEVLKDHQSILIPIGGQKLAHSMLLLVTKTSSKTFSMTHYNTGLGVLKWHTRWKNTGRFQTYIEIKNIPKSSIFQWNNWLDLMRISQTEDSIDSIYESLMQFTAKGQLQEPSKDIEDYDAKQNGYNCTAQCLMSFFRHQAISEAGKLGLDSPQEKEAAYKMIKTQLLMQYQLSFDKVDQVIATNFASVIKKLSAEIQMLEIASNESLCYQTLNQMRTVLNRFPPSIEQLLKEKGNSIFARYAALRIASGMIANLWEAKSILPPKKPYFALANAKFEHHKVMMDVWKGRLQHGKSQLEVLTTLLLHSNHVEFGIEKTVEFCIMMENSDQNKIYELLTKLHQYRKDSDHLVMRIVEKIKNIGNDNLANTILKYYNSM